MVLRSNFGGEANLVIRIARFAGDALAGVGQRVAGGRPPVTSAWNRRRGRAGCVRCRRSLSTRCDRLRSMADSSPPIDGRTPASEANLVTAPYRASLTEHVGAVREPAGVSALETVAVLEQASLQRAPAIAKPRVETRQDRTPGTDRAKVLLHRFALLAEPIHPMNHGARSSRDGNRLPKRDQAVPA